VTTEGAKNKNVNCVDLLEENLQLNWERESRHHMRFTLTARIGENQWAAVGFSPIAGKVIFWNATFFHENMDFLLFALNFRPKWWAQMQLWCTMMLRHRNFMLMITS